MMKIHKFIKINMILVLILLINACEEDFLSKYPIDAPSSETFYSNEKELIMAMNGCYTNLIITSANWGYFKSRMFPWHLETMSDIGWERYGNEICFGTHDSQSRWFSRVWSGLYNGIAKCNSLINNMDRAKDNVNEELFKRIKAEAKFLRAYHYHHLVELYGDVP